MKRLLRIRNEHEDALFQFVEEHDMVSLALLLAFALAIVHAVVARLPLFAVIPRYRWTSFAGGVSISFVFLEIFPELSHAKEKLEGSEMSVLHHLDNQFHLIALIGLLVFYGLGSFALRSKLFAPSAQDEAVSRPAVFWIRISGFAMLNVIFGYLLHDLSEHSIIDCILFFIAVALHFFITDENLREDHQSLYDKTGRWLLAGAIVMGAVIGHLVRLDETAIAIVWAFSAGSMILNVLMRELPEERETCFWSFFVGSAVYAALLLGK
jgi:hypothetical protein